MSDLGVPSFDAQTRALRVAQEVLGAHLREDRPPDEVETGLLATEVLPAVERIDRGIGLTELARRVDTTTARDLLRRSGVSGEPPSEAERVAAARERSIQARLTPDDIDLSAGAALAAANHARVVFAMIPRLPDGLVTWPGLRLPGGYVDIPAPSGIGSLIERVDELAGVLWRLAAGQRMDADEHSRRTYAFCETARWLELTLRAH